MGNKIKKHQITPTNSLSLKMSTISIDEVATRITLSVITRFIMMNTFSGFGGILGIV